MTTPSSLPTLDQVLADPGCTVDLSSESIARLLAQLAAVQSAIAARLIVAAAATNGAAPVVADELLSVLEVAKLLKRTPRWVWRSQKKLPFLRRVGGRGLIASRRELETWLARQRVK
jgi:hypothetical protein